MRRLVLLLCFVCGALFAGEFKSAAGYELYIPNGWEWGTGLMGSDLFAVAPEGENVGSANFNVMIGGSGGLDLNSLYDQSMVGLKELLEDVQIEESGTGKLGDLPARWHINTYLFQGSELKVLQYVAVDGPKAYALTFTTSNVDFKHYRPQFEEVVESFTVSNL